MSEEVDLQCCRALCVRTAEQTHRPLSLYRNVTKNLKKSKVRAPVILNNIHVMFISANSQRVGPCTHSKLVHHPDISLYINTTNNHSQHRTMLLFSSERPATKPQLTGFSDLNSSAHFKYNTSSESLDSESGCHWLEEGVVPVRLRWWQAVWWEGSVCWHRDSESLYCVFLSGSAWMSPSLSALKHVKIKHTILKNCAEKYHSVIKLHTSCCSGK